VLTGFGDARISSEIRGLELRPELMPRAFPFWGEHERCNGLSAREPKSCMQQCERKARRRTPLPLQV
jgi:hypothetical protein